jgi:cell filamentation protein
MYAVVPDPYCYPDSDVLINRPGIRSADSLEAFELVVTTQRADEPLPAGQLSVTHYRRVHHHLFQDVYPWAGKFRTVRLSKGSSAFCYPENIPEQMTQLFAQLRERRWLRNLDQASFAQGLARWLAELNAIHPFREGNGRTQLTFAALLTHQAGHHLHLERLQPEAFLHAMIESFKGADDLLVHEIAGLL